MEHIKEMPVDVISNIVSYCVGNPELMRLKYNQELKELLNKKFRITTTDTKTEWYKTFSTKETVSKYILSREKPLRLDSLERIIKQQRHELLYLIYDTVEDNQNFEANLMVRITGTELYTYPGVDEEDVRRVLIPVFFNEVKGSNIDTALKEILTDLQERITLENQMYHVRDEVNEIVGFTSIEFNIRISEY